MKDITLDIPKEELKKLGSQVIADYNDDYGSLAEYRKNVEEYVKIIASIHEKKTTPWDGAANVTLPVLSTAVLQIQARLKSVLMPPKKVCKVDISDNTDKDRATRVEKYINYELLNRYRHWRRDQDMNLMRLPTIGVSFKKVCRDQIRKSNVATVVDWDSLTLPYGTSSLDQAVRISHSIQMESRDINIRVERGIFHIDAEDGKFAHEVLSNANSSDNDLEDKSVKQSDARSEDDKSFTIIEQCLVLDLEEDGIGKPYIATVDLGSQKVLRVVENWDDEETYEPVQHYIAYQCLPNPKSGVYGWGMGVLLLHIAAAASTLMNQILDAGTLSNQRGGLVTRQSGIKRGSLNIEMGKFTVVDMLLGERISDHLHEWQFKGPSATTFNALSILLAQAKEVSSVTDITLGDMPPRDTPSSTITQLAEEGAKVFAAIFERAHTGFKEELGLIYRLMNKHFDEDKEHYIEVLGDEMYNKLLIEEAMKAGAATVQLLESNQLSAEQMDELVYRAVKDDFRPDCDIVPVSDPNIVNKEAKIAKAEAILQTTMSDPMTANNPEAIWAAKEEYYNALDIENTELFNPKPEPQIVDRTPIEEEARMLRDLDSDVLPEQDHSQHYASHEAFSQTDFFNMLSPQGKKLYEYHVKEHVSMLYTQMQQGGMNGAAGYDSV